MQVEKKILSSRHVVIKIGLIKYTFFFEKVDFFNEKTGLQRKVDFITRFFQKRMEDVKLININEEKMLINTSWEIKKM